MQDGSSVFQISYLTLAENIRLRKRIVFLSLFLVLFFAVTVLASGFILLARQTAARNWNEGWTAWKEGRTATALSCWSKDPFMAAVAPRPAKFYYWKARALERLGRYEEAKIVKYSLAEDFPFDFYTFLLFPDGGLSVLPREETIKTEALFHPCPWIREVRLASDRTGIPEYMIWAVMKRESKFKTDAVSQSGAIGLMQLMPATAGAEAESLKMINADIHLPEHNILLGANYLARQVKKFDGDIIRAIAAYNAGTASVVRWDTLSAADWAEWIEDIPYAETREFVRSVLENREIYRIICRSYNNQTIFKVAGETPVPIKNYVSAVNLRAEPMTLNK